MARNVRLAIASGLALACVALVPPGALAEGGSPSPSSVPRPANDALANAQPVKSFPATIEGTTVGATLEPGESESNCGGATMSSVWYSVRLPAAHRIGVNLAAAGELDAVVRAHPRPVTAAQIQSRRLNST